jgi:tRNA threonylcarbamoyladenosine biosynthesis protein TsaB
MASILNIETATPLCSVALAIDGRVISERESMEEKSHASRLTVFIEEILNEQGLEIRDLDAIAIGKGPGSYTGLRIGVSVAKGLCYGSNLPLIAANTLKILYTRAVSISLSQPVHKEEFERALLCPMIDARRMEVFTCLYTPSGEEVENISAKIIDQDSFTEYLSSHKIIFFGSGMEKCRMVLSHPNALFFSGVFPHASSLAALAEETYRKNVFEDLAYFEPFYLKDFIATIPKRGLPV